MQFTAWSSGAPLRCGASTSSPRSRPMARGSLALLLPLALAACNRGHANGAPPHDVVAVRLAPVTVERVAQPVVATGVLGPKEEVPLSFKIGGVIGRILVDEGHSVRAGDTLAALD